MTVTKQEHKQRRYTLWLMVGMKITHLQFSFFTCKQTLPFPSVNPHPKDKVQPEDFFGLFIQNNFISVDPKRTEKLLEAKMPTCPKGIRSFLGLVNSIRTSLGFNVLKNLPILNKLTSSKLRSFKPTPEEEKAFYETKVQLTSAPIFTKISDPNSAKLLFTDMSIGDTAVYSAILCQVVKPQNDKHHVKYYINLDDKNHISDRLGKQKFSILR